jgi:ribose/xylose/arabinose/galactoside ABC-type transport system permease subunit
MNPLLETLAANTVIRGFVLLIIPFSIINLNPVYTFAGNARTAGNIPIAVLIMLFSYLILSFIMNKTRFGRFLIATGGNPNASYIAGINVNNIILSAYALSGFFCGLAGLLATGRQSTISNVMGQGLIMEAIAGAILGGVALEGGRGTVWGMLGGALILGLFNNFLTLLAINVYWVTIIKGSLILFAIILDSLKKRLRIALLYRKKVETLGTIILPIKEEIKC